MAVSSKEDDQAIVLMERHELVRDQAVQRSASRRLVEQRVRGTLEAKFLEHLQYAPRVVHGVVQLGPSPWVPIDADHRDPAPALDDLATVEIRSARRAEVAPAQVLLRVTLCSPRPSNCHGPLGDAIAAITTRNRHQEEPSA